MENSPTKNNYKRKTQAKYHEKCMQIAIRYGLNDDDIMIINAIKQYTKEHSISNGKLARDAIMEKLYREKYL